MAIEVMLVDDHPIVRQGIKSVISQAEDINVTAEATNGKEAVVLAKKNSPDVIVMDVTLPHLNGLEASAQILKQNHTAKILILSMHDNRAFIEKALDYGAKGYILKDTAIDEIIHAVKEVNAGRYFLSAKISSFVIHNYISQRKKKLKLRSISLLTAREKEILQLIAEGLSNKQIAQQLDLSLKTVFVHRNNIMQKLDVHNQAKLIHFALKEGLASI